MRSMCSVSYTHLEDYDAVLVMTNAALDEQSVLDCIWRHFPKAFQEKTPGKDFPFHSEKDACPYIKSSCSPLSSRLRQFVQWLKPVSYTHLVTRRVTLF